MKKISILLLVLLMISTPVFADVAGAVIATGLIFAGMGGAFYALADGSSLLKTGGFTFLILGGGMTLLGLLSGIIIWTAEADAPSDGLYLVNAEGEASTSDISLVSQSGTVSPRTKDSIFNHLLFGTDGKNSYLGVRFSW